MTIMFYTRFRPVNEKGGTEHTTQVVAAGLARLYGIRSVSVWHNPLDGSMEPFAASIQLPDNRREAADAVEKIIRKYNVSCVVIQGYFHDCPMLHEAAARVEGCHVVFAHHFAPGWELLSKDKIYEKWRASRGLSRLRYGLKLALFPLFSLQSRLNMTRRYCMAYRMADRVVLLSEHYIRAFQRLALTHATSKFAVIPNAVPFSPVPADTLNSKEKTVLMVTRLDERQKRIFLALKIWKRIKLDARFSDWQLTVIGEGYSNESAAYQKYADENGIKQVKFLGRQKPLEYYKKASVFIMTSRCEGLPLTILECRAAWVVPVAFNTFGAVSDLIDSGKDGYIVEEGDIDGYVEKTKSLMADEPLRRSMALAGADSLKAFSNDEVMKKWHALLTSL